MRSKAAVLWEAPGKWQIEELEVAEPGTGDVQIRIEAAGLCHSDYAFKIDELVIQTYRLEEINEAYEDVRGGKVIRTRDGRAGEAERPAF